MMRGFFYFLIYSSFDGVPCWRHVKVKPTKKKSTKDPSEIVELHGWAMIFPGAVFRVAYRDVFKASDAHE
jgi:hypothetical protein